MRSEIFLSDLLFGYHGSNTINLIDSKKSKKTWEKWLLFFVTRLNFPILFKFSTKFEVKCFLHKTWQIRESQNMSENTLNKLISWSVVISIVSNFILFASQIFLNFRYARWYIIFDLSFIKQIKTVIFKGLSSKIIDSKF